VDSFHLAADNRDVVVVTRKLKTHDLQKAAAIAAAFQLPQGARALSNLSNLTSL